MNQSKKMLMASEKYSEMMNGWLDGSGWVPDASYDSSTRPWYKSAIENNGVIYTAPFLDKPTQKIVISIAAPVTRDNKVIDVVSSDINLGKLTEIIEKARGNIKRLRWKSLVLLRIRLIVFLIELLR